MKLTKHIFSLTLALAGGALLSHTASAEQSQAEREAQAQKTEVWEPVPKSVATPIGKAPSDAVILFSGDDLSAWEGLKGGEAPWTISGDVLTVKPGAGDIKTKQNFCDVQLHMEWRTPTQVEGMRGQQRNNSGIFFQQRYEVQVLDSYENPTYSNGQAGSVYKQTIPLVNAMRPAGEWQYYDIIYSAPRFDGEQLKTPGYITVMHNGVVVQNHTEIQGKTEWIGAPSYEAHGCAPLQLQDHGNLVSFRNIWLREL
ncbi:MAG: hypothetical protein CL578_24300 [Alteromonadaceae bacterium]|uniref:Large, multifunctional secreted protein n=1 Tax=Paraglaciecola chathamensis TaxID=368405 RepID=A0A8H9M341_9ALTE|nr:MULTISPECIES: DUF1080 domain-containing protein [Paraglaciecola]MBN28139.1 hypothetical protein [Alteromonadaceae bacterium]GGZ81359.1 large, multifunctional secreted protein [Paraglaciecola oceanifecundans]|tara:strand:- start:18117 stop:18881 length:765 start_codon:yes stop_codon:yes gene_type:complete